VYYPVDIYFAGLFGFDGLELGFFGEDINAGRGEKERDRGKKVATRMKR